MDEPPPALGKEPLLIRLLDEIASFRHVIWDLNGTLVDDAGVCVRAVNPILREHGLPEIDLDRYRECFRFPVSEYYRDLGFRLSPREFEEISHRFHGHYHDLLEGASLFTGTRELLSGIRGRDQVQSILTAAWHEDLERILARFDLNGLFHHLYGLSHRQADSKVARGFDLLRASGVAAEDTVLLGDTLHDLEVGEALGVTVILLTGGHMSESRLEAGGVKVVRRS